MLLLRVKKCFENKFILLTAFVVMGITLSIFSLWNHYTMLADSCNYATAGKNLVEGRGYTIGDKAVITFPSFYPIVIGLLDKIVGNLELSAHLVPVISWVGIIIVFFFFTKELYGTSKISLLATALLASNGFLLLASTIAITESLFIFLSLCSIYFTMRILNSPFVPLTLVACNGFVLGLSYLTRPEGVFYFIITMFSLSFLWHAGLRQKSVRLLIMLICFLTIALPHVFYLHANTGKWQFSEKYSGALISGEYFTSNDTASVTRKVHSLSQDKKSVGLLQEESGFFKYIKKHPKAMIARYIKNLKTIQRTIIHLISLLGLILVAAGFFTTHWDSTRKRKECFLILIMTIMFIYPFFFVYDRYLFQFLPILIVWESKGLFAVKDWLEHLLRSKRVINGLILFFCFIIVGYSLRPDVYRLERKKPDVNKEMGLWMKEHIKGIEEEYIVSYAPCISFYAGAKQLLIPSVDNYNDLITYLKLNNAKYFIINQKYVSSAYPALSFLLDEKLPRNNLKEVYTLKKPPNVKIVLYKIEE